MQTNSRDYLLITCYRTRTHAVLIDTHTEQWRCILELKMVLQSDAIEEPFLIPQRTFQTRVL